MGISTSQKYEILTTDHNNYLESMREKVESVDRQ